MDIPTPEISVITLNFNQTKYLASAIASVRCQSGATWQHIIVDPGSVDGAQDVYRSLRQDPRYVILEEPDRGPADGLNKGLATSTGQVIYCLNADDVVLPQAFSGAIATLRRRKSWAGVAGHGYIIDADGNRRRRVYSTFRGAQAYARGFGVALHQATFLRRSAMTAVGGFNIENRISWDGEMLVDLDLAGFHVGVVNEFWGEFRVYADSITGSQVQAARYTEEYERLSHKVLGRDARRIDCVVAGMYRGRHFVVHPVQLLLSAYYRKRGMQIPDLARGD